MKSLSRGVIVAGLLITLAGATAFANVKKSTITLSVDTKVNDTIVKKGMYQVVFDDQTGELSLFKGAKLVAKTAARVEKREMKARGTEVQTILEGMDQKLVGITFGGSYDNVRVGQASMQAGAN